MGRAALVTTRLAGRSMRSRVSAAVAVAAEGHEVGQPDVGDDPQRRRSVGGSPPLSVASRIWIHRLRGRVPRRRGVCDGEGLCHGCRQPGSPAVMQMCGEGVRAVAVALTHSPSRQRSRWSAGTFASALHQQSGFRREIAVKRADGDADPLGNRPHLNRLVTTGRGHKVVIQNCFAAPCGGA